MALLASITFTSILFKMILSFFCASLNKLLQSVEYAELAVAELTVTESLLTSIVLLVGDSLQEEKNSINAIIPESLCIYFLGLYTLVL